MLSVILDEFAPFAYPGFTQVLQTARGARVSFLFSFQSMPQLQRVSQAFADEVSSAPGTKMIMNVSEENTAQWFLKASARIATKRRSLSVRRTGIFSTKYTETGTGSESDIKETRAREDHIKNLPVGQMEILMVDSREGTRYSHLHVRRAPRFQLEGLEPSLYPEDAQLSRPRDRCESPLQGGREPEAAAQEDGGIVPRRGRWRVKMRAPAVIRQVLLPSYFAASPANLSVRPRASQAFKPLQSAPKAPGVLRLRFGQDKSSRHGLRLRNRDPRGMPSSRYTIDDLYFWSNVVTLLSALRAGRSCPLSVARY